MIYSLCYILYTISKFAQSFNISKAPPLSHRAFATDAVAADSVLGQAGWLSLRKRLFHILFSDTGPLSLSLIVYLLSLTFTKITNIFFTLTLSQQKWRFHILFSDTTPLSVCLTFLSLSDNLNSVKIKANHLKFCSVTISFSKQASLDFYLKFSSVP